MFKIGFENFRSLKQIDLVEIKPLTILVGANSSGKSSFIRSLSLLKQSIETEDENPITWYNYKNSIDFGSFEDTISSENKNGEIKFKFEFLNDKNDGNKIYLEFSIIKKKMTEYINNIRIKHLGNNIELFYNKNGIKSVKMSVENDEKIIIYEEVENRKYNQQKMIYLPEFFNYFFDHYNDSKVSKIINQFSFYEKFEKKKRLKKIPSGALFKEHRELENLKSYFLSYFYEKSEGNLYECLIQEYNDFKGSFYEKFSSFFELDENEDLKEIYFFYLIINLSNYVNFIDSTFQLYIKNLNYVAPTRTMGERYYRIGPNTGRIDASGENMGIFLYKLSNENFKSLNKWLYNNFGFTIRIDTKNVGFFSIKLEIKNEEFNLLDLGTGFSQILPILLSIWNKSTEEIKRNRQEMCIFAIEQPELHLHPKFQADFIDVLFRIRKKRKELYFIIETHSETIINRVCEHVLMEKVNGDQINILLFNKENNGTKIEEAKFNKENLLENWPLRFFRPDRLGE